MRASRARRGLLVLVAGIFATAAKTSGEPDECVNPTRQTCCVSTSPQALAPPHTRRSHTVVPLATAAGVSSAHFFLGGKRLPHPRYTAALVDAPLRSVCRASPCSGKPFTEWRLRQRPTPSLRPHSPPPSTPPKVCLEIMEFDFRCRHGTTTTHAPHSSPKVAWDMTSTRCQIGRSQAPAPS